MKNNLVAIGDLHGNYKQLETVLSLLGLYKDDSGKWQNPREFKIVQMGDAVDYRGEWAQNHSALTCLTILRELEKDCGAIILQSNHNDKFYRWLNGNKVQINQGLDNTIKEIEAMFEKKVMDLAAITQWKEDMKNWVGNLPCYHIEEIEGHKYIFVHAYFKPKWAIEGFGDPTEKQKKTIRDYMLRGKRNEDDERWLWWQDEEHIIPDNMTIMAAHYHYVDLRNPRAKIVDATPDVVAYLVDEDKIIKGYV